MRNKLLLLIIILFTSTKLYAIEKDSCHKANNLIEMNLWSFIPIDNVTFYNFQYLRKITCKNAFGIDIKIPVSSKVSGFGIGLEYRHYFFKKA